MCGVILLTVTVMDVVVVVSRTVEVHGAEVKQTIIASGVPSSLPPTYTTHPDTHINNRMVI